MFDNKRDFPVWAPRKKSPHLKKKGKKQEEKDSHLVCIYAVPGIEVLAIYHVQLWEEDLVKRS